MLIHRLTGNERTIYVLQQGDVHTNFTTHETNEKTGAVALYNRGFYVGLVGSKSRKNFKKALLAAKARRAVA